MNYTENDLHYLAGIVDGEGCIRIAKINNPNNQVSYSIQLHIVNTNFELLEHLQKKFGGKLSGQRQVGVLAKPIKSLVWHGINAENLLNRVGEFLIVKKKQIEVLNKFLHKGNHGKLTYNNEERILRLEVWEEMRNLNRKGGS